MDNNKNILQITFLLLLSFLCSNLFAQTKTIDLKIVETSDVHGNYFPYDYVEQTASQGGLSRIYTYVKQQRESFGENLLLLDNGDIIDGQPTVYYYNYIDTVSPHICADMMNFMQYDAGCLGNHDIETGEMVVGRWKRQCRFPLLAANLLRESDGSVYGEPYIMFEREGVRIAVLGLTTAATPAWVCKSLWKGLLFKDLEETAREWMAILREKEKPDVVIGLFHSGGNARMVADRYKDDVSLEIARQVPGFDIVLMGHDHTLCNEKIVNVNGDSVLVINPGHEGAKVADVSLQIIVDEGKVIRKQVCGQLVDVDEYEPDPVFLKQFDKAQQLTSRFVSKKIGVITETMTTRPAYFGPSAFVDYLHSLQLDITGADISFASPLSFDAQITRGDISVGDMFRLYRYKNLIYTMTLTGKEVRDYLEESYAQWTNQMLSPDDHLLLFRDNYLLQGEESFTNMYYYFDSAAGIIYTVNVTKPKGEKVDILCMSDGSAFHEDRHYDVAMTSYRANGGGDLLTKGAGLSVDALDSRVKAITQKDFRYYLIQSIKIDKVIHPDVLNHWKFIPEDWVKAATEKDYLYLFGED